jgi:hypothetical protein
LFGACALQSLNQINKTKQPTLALIIGSAPDALVAQNYDLSAFSHRVAINNSWQITPDWDYLVYPEDLLPERLPPSPLKDHQELIDAAKFVPEQNKLGGFVYAGGTMAFTAAYWTLGALRPDLIAFLGCDMIYTATNGESNHFYGHGTSDPLRADITLQSLEAKSLRFLSMANSLNCAVVNLSKLPQSRLVFPRAELEEMSKPEVCKVLLDRQKNKLNMSRIEFALSAEKDLGYMVPSGRYWEHLEGLDESKLRQIDDLWLQTLQPT